MMSSFTSRSTSGAAEIAPAPAVAADPVISGQSAMDFHESVPSLRTFVERLARPPVIQARICSTVTGPYSFPSPPMIVYMGRIHHYGVGASIMPSHPRDRAGRGEYPHAC